MLKNKFLLLCVFSFALSLGYSQILINEYSASNLADFPDDYGKYEDWIELYNAGSSAVDLEGWHLSDKATKPTKFPIPAGVSINPGALLVVWCSGRNELNGDDLHTNFKLTQTKGNEILIVANPAGEIVQEIPMELAHLGHSRGRTTNGADEWSIDKSPSPGASNFGGDKYAGYLDEPIATLEAGFYFGTQMVGLTDLPDNATVHYTLDGNLPTANSPIYTAGEEFTITETTVFKAIAISTGNSILRSKVNFNTYFIDESFSLPVFSVGADDIQTLANGTGFLRPHGSLEYFTKSQERTAISYGELNRHGQDSWILPHRSLDWISRDEMGYNKAVQTELFSYSDRDEYQRFMFRASGDDNYPANDDFNHQGSAHVRDEYVHTLAMEGDMKLDVRALERVVVFLNGDYWGVYGLRERPVDHDYTAEYYDQGKYDIQYLTTWGNTEAEYGGNQAFIDWGNFRDFILDNDMSIQSNYDSVKAQMQVKGLCDYMIANLNSVASDWLNYNTGWWRGLDQEGNHKKWGYILWDNDATFDYYINYSGVPNTDPDAVACDIDEIADFVTNFFNGNDVGAHQTIFLKLLEESPEFQQLYFSRQADLINTAWSCDVMLTKFDSLIAIIAPEMPRQINRWGGSVQEWQTNVQQMRLFIQDRCELIDDGMVECYDLTGPHSITLDVEPQGAGKIEFNTLDIETFPWTGEYFGNMENIMEAKSLDPNMQFIRWETSNGSVIAPDSSMRKAGIFLEGEEVLTAVFGVGTAVVDVDLGLEMSAYPTVFRDQFTISLKLDKAVNLDFDLIDATGKVILNMADYSQKYSEGDHAISVDLDQSIPSGMYFLQVKTESSVRTLKVMSAN